MPISLNSYVPQYASQDFRKRALLLWLVVVASALTVMGLTFAAPFCLARGYAFSSKIIYKAFSQVCHQIPQRSFYLKDHPVAVCARCLGVYAGFAMGALCYPLLVLRPFRSRQGSLSLLPLLVAALPVGIDFTLGWLGLWENTHLSRVVTGGLFGFMVAFYVVPGVINLSCLKRTERAPL